MGRRYIYIYIYFVFNLLVDGRWGSWSKFGACTKSCGRGVQRKSRKCNNPSPQHNGKDCVGSATVYRHCNTQHCPGKSCD